MTDAPPFEVRYIAPSGEDVTDGMLAMNFPHHAAASPVTPERFVENARALADSITSLIAERDQLKRDLAGANSLVSDIEAAVPGWRAYRDLADAVTCRLADLTRERDEARRAASLGCDANGGGPHTVITDHSYKFCGACGEAVRAPALAERLRAATARADAAESALDDLHGKLASVRRRFTDNADRVAVRGTISASVWKEATELLQIDIPPAGHSLGEDA